MNVNHPAGNHGGPRDYQDRIGRLVGVAVTPDGLRADFHFNPKHALAEQLMWDAEHAPENVGFSHNVEANVSRRNGKVVVEEIVKVQSVDLVADPATTRGLFEGSDPATEKKRLVEAVAAEINFPIWALPPMDTGLSYRHTPAEIRSYLLELREVYVRRGIIEALDLPDPEGAKQFAAAVTTDGSYDPNTRKQFNDATDLADADEVKEFVRKITD